MSQLLNRTIHLQNCRWNAGEIGCRCPAPTRPIQIQRWSFEPGCGLRVVTSSERTASATYRDTDLRRLRNRDLDPRVLAGGQVAQMLGEGVRALLLEQAGGVAPFESLLVVPPAFSRDSISPRIVRSPSRIV